MAGTFEIYRDSQGEFRFRLRARNGEVVAVGQTYPTKAAAKRGVAAVLRAAAGARIVDQTESERA